MTEPCHPLLLQSRHYEMRANAESGLVCRLVLLGVEAGHEHNAERWEIFYERAAMCLDSYFKPAKPVRCAP